MAGITEKSIKILWANAAGFCSFDGCNIRVTGIADGPYTLGEMAHIKGNRSGSNRYDPQQSDSDRHDYNNLILLCPTHHTLIDKPENEATYTVDVLLDMKKRHEETVLAKLNEVEINNLDELKYKINQYLTDNYNAWNQYGPLSERAQKNPQSESLYETWVQVRSEIIVPNNRAIKGLLKLYGHLFSKSHQQVVSEFILHVDSYEKWVTTEISYEPVIRFPESFQNLIQG
ncbi:HNH endonuclease signature motif containing protein [Acinetobacter baumannii]|uniref:HNH endonuclease signature motif containing protein n=1 Tax=Acinetobacter baumannii TaxID=470 RepID=UPI001F1FC681|nr:HNH endonuclease signature motif containing protein [Acinetobacter baumannii]MCF7214237.1 HNH endonuclease [Acinetobacter baumannii]MDR9543689.1 HNH endonuclease signature motif containing protein [Acinetobacter baumannii]HCA5287279.1 HNH endonuclease [Acinetobacter nosocomialis]